MGQAQVKTETGISQAQSLYDQARVQLSQENPEAALSLLRRSFEAGFENPMQLIADEGFQFLIHDPTYRRKIRALLRQHAIQNHATMVPKKEPGDRISVLGEVRDERNETPIANATVELIHADQKGRYFDEESTWNPRIFAYVKTDEKGRFSIDTIRPGQYREDSGDLAYSHIHFAINWPGFRPYQSEFTFEDAPILRKQGNPEQVPVATLEPPDVPNSYRVIIRLQRN